MRKGKALKNIQKNRISQYVLTLLITLSAFVFGAFYLIGYDFPYESNPRFNAPLLTDALLLFVFLLLIITVIVTAVSVIRGIKLSKKVQSFSNGVPARKIFCGTILFTLIVMVISFVCGSTQTLNINGKIFDSILWLKVCDMFINTSLTLIVIAVIAVAFGFFGFNRKLKKRHE